MHTALGVFLYFNINNCDSFRKAIIDALLEVVEQVDNLGKHFTDDI